MNDECELCPPHPFHGLPCERHVYVHANSPYQATPCPCRGPYATTEETQP